MRDIDESDGLELEAWRAVWGVGGIQEALERVAAVGAARIPFDLALVRRLDVANTRLDTLAVTTAPASSPPSHARTELPAGLMDEIVGWCLEKRIARLGPGRAGLVRAMLPAGTDGAVLAAPLFGTEGPIGLLMLVARGVRRFGPLHERLARALIAPLTAAMERERRDTAPAAAGAAADRERRSGLQPMDISESIVGAETGLREVMERVVLVARTDAPVLILGETGSGKEVVARAIHSRSHRASGPVLRVNCGAIPPELVDSELFGHERGSFTGAVAGRKGWFERADGGTLFLDEIGDLPLAAQVRLLRILQDGSFERVGSQHSRSVDVRIVTATHRDLRAMVREGRFREDLWYRISVFPIVLPPLRDRRDDIPSLAVHFAEKAGLRLGVKPLVPSPDDVQRLMAYDWPGNVRELAAVIERAAILGHGHGLDVTTALGVGSGALPPARFPTQRGRDAETGPRPIETLDRAMADHIERALERCSGRIEGREGAAALLAINPHTLRSRMRKLGIDWSRYRAADA